MYTFEMPLVHGTLIKRYKRFLSDIQLDDGTVVIAHCTNSGSMKSCLEEGAEVFLSPAKDPKRKTRFTWEMIKINESWIGINTMVPNKLAFDLIKDQVIPPLMGYDTLKREVTYQDSRIDLFATNAREECFIEVKNVTLKVETEAQFPDAVTVRGRKHLNTLMRIKEAGMRAVMLYVIQRMDVEQFCPATHIDPGYAETLKEAHAKGVEIIPVQVKVSPNGIDYHRILPYHL